MSLVDKFLTLEIAMLELDKHGDEMRAVLRYTLNKNNTGDWFDHLIRKHARAAFHYANIICDVLEGK